MIINGYPVVTENFININIGVIYEDVSSGSNTNITITSIRNIMYDMFNVSCDRLKYGGNLFHFLEGMFSTLIFYYPSLVNTLGKNNIIIKYIHNVLRKYNIHNEIILNWSNLLMNDYNKKKSNMFSLKLPTEQALNQNIIAVNNQSKLQYEDLKNELATLVNMMKKQNEINLELKNAISHLNSYIHSQNNNSKCKHKISIIILLFL